MGKISQQAVLINKGVTANARKCNERKFSNVRSRHLYTPSKTRPKCGYLALAIWPKTRREWEKREGGHVTAFDGVLT